MSDWEYLFHLSALHFDVCTSGVPNNEDASCVERKRFAESQRADFIKKERERVGWGKRENLAVCYVYSWNFKIDHQPLGHKSQQNLSLMEFSEMARDFIIITTEFC